MMMRPLQGQKEKFRQTFKNTGLRKVAGRDLIGLTLLGDYKTT